MGRKKDKIKHVQTNKQSLNCINTKKNTRTDHLIQQKTQKTRKKREKNEKALLIHAFERKFLVGKTF